MYHLTIWFSKINICLKQPTKKACKKIYKLLLLFKIKYYSTVTDLAKLRGWSTLHSRITAMW